VAGYHLRTQSLGNLLVLIRKGCCRGAGVFATRVGNPASPVIYARFTTTTGGHGTSSYRPPGQILKMLDRYTEGRIQELDLGFIRKIAPMVHVLPTSRNR
jgi:hypothetical protein